MGWIRDVFGKSLLTENDLSALTSITGEERHIEFKLTWNKKILNEIVAFANNDGGLLFIGVSDEGVPVGITDCDEISTSISHQVRDLIFPSLSSFINMVPIKISDNHSCVLVVEIDSTPFCYGVKRKVSDKEIAYSFYMRNGSSCESLSPIDLNTLIPSKTDKKYNSNFRSGIGRLLSEFLHYLVKFTQTDKEFGLSIEEFFLTSLNLGYSHVDKRLTPVILKRKRSDIFYIYSYARDLLDSLGQTQKRILHRNLTYEEDQGLLDVKNSLREFLDSYLSSTISGKKPVSEGEKFSENLSIMPIFSPLLRKVGQMNIIHKSYEKLEKLLKNNGLSLNEIYRESVSLLRNERIDSNFLDQIENILQVHLYEYTTPFSIILFRLIHYISKVNATFTLTA